jgi:hypothetical protein
VKSRQSADNRQLLTICTAINATDELFCEKIVKFAQPNTFFTQNNTMSVIMALKVQARTMRQLP